MKSQSVTTLQDKLRDTNRLLNYYTQFIGDCFGSNEFSDVEVASSHASRFSLNTTIASY